MVSDFESPESKGSAMTKYQMNHMVQCYRIPAGILTTAYNNNLATMDNVGRVT